MSSWTFWARCRHPLQTLLVSENMVEGTSAVTETIKVIPCLDIKNGRVVKGVKFLDLRDAGDPAELAHRYSTHGADAVALLDLSASNEGRSTTLEVVRKTASRCEVPLIAGGGVNDLAAASRLFDCGVAQVTISTAAVAEPKLISEVSREFGPQAVVLSLDARRSEDSTEDSPRFEVTTHGGTRGTGIDAASWAAEAEQRGAAEILVNSIDEDGVQGGFDLELLRQVRDRVSIPIIASGGAGTLEHFVEGARAGANAVLGASVFHFGVLQLREVKKALAQAGFNVDFGPGMEQL